MKKKTMITKWFTLQWMWCRSFQSEDSSGKHVALAHWDLMLFVLHLFYSKRRTKLDLSVRARQMQCVGACFVCLRSSWWKRCFEVSTLCHSLLQRDRAHACMHTCIEFKYKGTRKHALPWSLWLSASSLHKKLLHTGCRLLRWHTDG